MPVYRVIEVSVPVDRVVQVPVPVDRVVEVPVPVDRIVEVHVPVDRVIAVERVVEKEVFPVEEMMCHEMQQRKRRLRRIEVEENAALVEISSQSYQQPAGNLFNVPSVGSSAVPKGSCR